jgi:hypothetical protein
LSQRPGDGNKLVNEFVNETLRDYPDGVERRVIGGTGD